MKKACITILIFAIIVVVFAGVFIGEQSGKTEYLRIHIRAESNEEQDQAVKYLVKEEVVNYLAPYLAECDSKDKAEKTLADKLEDIANVANETLVKNGFFYGAKASIKKEKFPTRTYNELTLESGFYDALIIELGSAKGDNWWCVVYPPLCFTKGGFGYVYKSKIYEIIKSFIEKKEKE